MTRPTDVLREDHAVVCQGLGALAAIGEHVRRGGHFPAQDTVMALRFLREFLIATHFRKENEIVWPTVAMRADDEDAALVGNVMHDQEDATELITTLVVFWEPTSELTAAERQGFADTVEALHKRLHLMMDDEERLFVACDRHVPPDDRIDWIEQFAAVEAERSPRARWIPEIRRLVADWVA